MSKVIGFAPPSRASALGAAFLDAVPYAEAALIAQPEPHSHAVQFYESEEFLAAAVGKFLAAGIEAGDRVIVIASAQHTATFIAELTARKLERALVSGQLLLLDARTTLSRFMVDGAPDGEKFRAVLREALDRARADQPNARVRAYGEMVDLLWRDGNASAALQLEQLWNEEGSRHSFELLCAYAMGSFYREGDQERFLHMCSAHSHVFPTESFLQLDPRARLKEIGVLQQRAQLLEAEIQQRRVVETKLREALAEQRRLEEQLREALERERELRAKAEASDHIAISR